MWNSAPVPLCTNRVLEGICLPLSQLWGARIWRQVFFVFFLSCSFARHQQITRLSRRQEIEREPTKWCSQRSLVAATGHITDTIRTLTKAFADFVIICQESVLLWGCFSEMSCWLILAKLKSIDPTEFSWAQCLSTGHWPPETQSQTAIWLFFFFIRSHPHKAAG